ncbi:DUF5687 family protein [Salinibacter altiplanensis]|uniref:DUF5687 family protein n=1 Tax=Salinibacter altiplanensis TaxID=1803181 RepID=UPI000C9EFD44|nr:DUF5687 family protein [Salinibacter altiplanensis]
MRALRILLRHRVTRWLRDPSWGTGTVAGQIVLLGLLLLLLAPLGLGSYVLGDVLRELYPEADALRLINGGMLYLVPVFTASRFFLQALPSERGAAYTTLPVSQTGLLNGQIALSLLSVHTVFAVVLVGPVWAAEVATAWPSLGAAAWLAIALLATVVLPSYGANLLHLLLGRWPWGFVGALAGVALVVVVDAMLGPDLFRGLSRGVFGRPSVGVVAAVGGVGGMHAALLWVMRPRLEVDRRARQRIGGSSRRGAAFYRWVERTLPMGRLVALELRQIVRTRRLRGMMLYTSLALGAIHGWGLIIVVSGGSIEPFYIVLACTTGIGGAALGLGPVVFGASSSYADVLFAHPHRLVAAVRAKLIVLWAGTVPGTVLLLGVCAGLPASRSAFFIASVFWWWGIVVPGFVWMGMYARKPVDLSASHFSFRTSSLHEIGGLLLALAPMFTFVDATGYWWSTSVLLGAPGLVGLLACYWMPQLLTRRFRARRHEMLAGFRENEPI